MYAFNKQIQRHIYLPAAAYFQLSKDKHGNNPNGGLKVGSILQVAILPLAGHHLHELWTGQGEHQ